MLCWIRLEGRGFEKKALREEIKHEDCDLELIWKEAWNDSVVVYGLAEG